MASYTIEQVTGPNQWAGPNGPVNFFDLKLQGVAEVVGLGQKPERQAPQVGEQINLILEPDPRKPGKLKGKREQAGGFGGGPRPEDPKRAAAIQRMHDQDMALRAVELALSLALVKPADTKGLFNLISDTADWFGKDVQRARDAA